MTNKIWTSMLAMAVMLLTACTDSESKLEKRAAELCQYVPDHELLEQSREYMTEDFYAVLDTMFNLPEQEELAHEWLYYFVTGNGGTIADYEVTDVQRIDATHAVANIKVRQKWEDGSFDESTDVEMHCLYMEKVGGQWLMSDFDEHKADCIQYLANYRREQAVRDAMADYLVSRIGSGYLQGELCVPTLMIVAAEEQDSTHARVWCDTWVDWYRVAGDTLKSVSGGNHSGCMSLEKQADGKLIVTDFEQTVDGAGNDASARRIFGTHYEVYQNVHSNADIREALRRLQLQNYVSQHKMEVHYYQDYGWPAVALQ